MAGSSRASRAWGPWSRASRTGVKLAELEGGHVAGVSDDKLAPAPVDPRRNLGNLLLHYLSLHEPHVLPAPSGLHAEPIDGQISADFLSSSRTRFGNLQPLGSQKMSGASCTVLARISPGTVLRSHACMPRAARCGAVKAHLHAVGSIDESSGKVESDNLLKVPGHLKGSTAYGASNVQAAALLGGTRRALPGAQLQVENVSG
jgi:hypothetical protein